MYTPIPETVIENQDIALDEAHAEAFYRSDVFDDTTDIILDHLLAVPVPPEKYKTIANPDSALNHNITHVWNGILEASNTPILANPRFIEDTQPNNYTTLDGYRAAIHTEVQKRVEETHLLNLFDNLFDRAVRPEDFIKLVDMRAFFVEHSNNYRLTLGHFVNQISVRSVELSTDPDYGDADPLEAAQRILPATRYLLEHESHRTGLAPHEINSRVSATLLYNRHGTAEDVTELRLREILHDEGLEGFRDTASARRQSNLTSERYVTRATLQSVRQALLSEYGFSGLPEGVAAINAIHDTVIRTLKMLAGPGRITASENPDELESDQRITNSILNAYEKLKHDPKYGGERGVPLNTTVKIANILSPDLNQREGLTGDQSLEPLEEQGYSDLPAAFQRILFAINPRYLHEATAGSIKDTNSQLRLVMVYIEALAQQWTDYQKLKPGLSVGDYVLRLNAKGYSAQEITSQIESISSGRPDRKASDHMATVISDPNTKKSRVVFKRFKPGYGVIS